MTFQVLMPTLGETSSTTVQECMAAGIPFLVSRAGGVPELLDSASQRQLLFPVGAVEVIADMAQAAFANGCVESRDSPAFALST